VPGVAFVIVSVRSIDESISGIRTLELYWAEMFIADVRLRESSVAISSGNNFIISIIVVELFRDAFG